MWTITANHGNTIEANSGKKWRLPIYLKSKLKLVTALCFLTREYAKRNERVIGMVGNFTHSLAHSLAHSPRHSIQHSDVNFRSLITPLLNA